MSYTEFDEIDGAGCLDHPLCPWCGKPSSLKERISDETYRCGCCSLDFTVHLIISPLGKAFLTWKVVENARGKRINGKENYL